MLQHAGDRMISVTTILTDEQIKILKQAISQRRAKLRRLSNGNIEASLWLMEELEHLNELLKNNLKRLAKTAIVA